LEKKRVADLIDVERDLLSHGVTAIYAGVGAGKNSFVEGYHDGDVDYEGLSEKYKVLLITSRKAKVLETKANTDNFLTDLRRFPNIDFEEIERINQSIVCTNAHIQRIIEHEYTHIGTVLCLQRISAGCFPFPVPVLHQNAVLADGDSLFCKIHIIPCQR